MLLFYPIFVMFVNETQSPILDLKGTKNRINVLYGDLHLS